MFGQMQVTLILQLSKLGTADEAVAKLLEFAEYPKSGFPFAGCGCRQMEVKWKRPSARARSGGSRLLHRFRGPRTRT